MDLNDIPTLELDVEEPLDKGDARGGKYYRRIPKAGGGYRYFYTKAAYEKEHGPSAHLHGPEVQQHRFDAHVATPHWPEGGTSQLDGARFLSEATHAMKIKDYKKTNELAARVTQLLAHGAPDGVVDDEKSLRSAWRKLNPGSTKDDLNEAIDLARGIHKGQRFVVSSDLFFKAAGHKYISRKPDGKGGWVYSYADDGEQIKIASKRAPFDIKTRDGTESREGVHAGDYALHREKGYGGMRYHVTHKPSGMSVDSSFHRGEGEALLHHFADHGGGIGADISNEDQRKITAAKVSFKHDFDHRDASKHRRAPKLEAGEAVKSMRGERMTNLSKGAGHKYTSKKADGRGGYTYIYAHPESGEQVRVNTHDARVSNDGPTTFAHHHVDQKIGTAGAQITGSEAEPRLRVGGAAGTSDPHIHSMLIDAAKDHHKRALAQSAKRAAKQGMFTTKKSMQHEGETEMMESTPHLRAQVKMVIEQMDPLAKGIYAFEGGMNQAPKIPDEYLLAYLDAFIEEAFEHERREKGHDENAVVVGISQPEVGSANGGIGGDSADYWAQWVLNELITYCGKNANLMRAVEKAHANKDFVASRLRAMGLVKPSMNGGEVNGDFMEGYQYSEQQTAAGIGKSVGYDRGAFSTSDELHKALERTQSIRAEEEATVKLEDDGINPIEMLANVHRARFNLMEDVFGIDLGMKAKR